MSLDSLCRWQVQVSVYCAWRIPAHLRCTQCSILLHLMDICFLTCICLWQISQIQTFLFKVVGPGLVSTQFAQQLETTVTAPPLVGCVVWSLNEEITSDIHKHKQNIWKEHLDAHWDHRHNTHILWKTIHGLFYRAPPPTLNPSITFSNHTQTHCELFHQTIHTHCQTCNTQNKQIH